MYLISVVLGAGKDETSGDIMSFVETKRMFEWGFHNYSYQKIVNSGEPVVEVPVEMSQEANAVVAVTQRAGAREADVSYNGRSYGRVKLVALTGVERSNFMYSVDQVKAYLSNPTFLWIAGGSWRRSACIS